MSRSIRKYSSLTRSRAEVRCLSVDYIPMSRGRGGRIVLLVVVMVVLASAGFYIAMQLGATADERVQNALKAKRGDAEVEVVRLAGPPVVRRAIDDQSPKDVCSKQVNPTSAWALEYPLPNAGVGKFVRQLTGPSSRIFVCLDAEQRVVNTYRFVY